MKRRFIGISHLDHGRIPKLGVVLVEPVIPESPTPAALRHYPAGFLYRRGCAGFTRWRARDRFGLHLQPHTLALRASV